MTPSVPDSPSRTLTMESTPPTSIQSGRRVLGSRASTSPSFRLERSGSQSMGCDWLLGHCPPWLQTPELLWAAPGLPVGPGDPSAGMTPGPSSGTRVFFSLCCFSGTLGSWRPVLWSQKMFEEHFEVPASLENHHSITPSASGELSGLRCGCLLPKAGMACACPAWGAAWVQSTCTRPQSRGSLHSPRCPPQVCQEWMELNVSFCTFLPIAAVSRALSIQQALNKCLGIGWFIDSCIHSSQPAIAYP